tara:strand:- start:1741 stop:1884 length:144 start_codon:yes stop_codon:yes gene_type:complete
MSLGAAIYMGVTMNGVAKCPEMDLNHRPIDFQSIALPLSYQDYNFIS